MDVFVSIPYSNTVKVVPLEMTIASGRQQGYRGRLPLCPSSACFDEVIEDVLYVGVMQGSVIFVLTDD
jgi:hypothetical protein